MAVCVVILQFKENGYFSGNPTLLKCVRLPFEKEFTLKSQTLLPWNAFFPLRVGPFSERTSCTGTQTGVKKVVPILKVSENLSSICNPFD